MIELLVRADDIGMAHAANEACIEVFDQGICRSVELMPTCPWFAEAAQLLRERPLYDAGVHLTREAVRGAVKTYIGFWHGI
ncbi:MAG: putative glycoside hydrolase/deacetylase ChbG (UPF0249 family) [Candidatus Latescibacterota bacterium]